MTNTITELEKIWNNKEFRTLEVVKSNSFVFSEISEAPILITGINPSKRKGEEVVNYSSYKYQDLIVSDRYFKKLHDIFPDSLNKNAFTYTDLFYHRNTEQSNI